MEVLAAKLTALFVLFLTAIIFGLLPIRLLGEVGRRVKASKTWKFRSNGLVLVDCLNCFAGGVFFSTGLLHLLPDVRRGIESVMDSLNRTNEFPFAEFLASVGVFVVIILEQSLTECSHGSGGGHGPKKKLHSEDDENLELLDFDKTEDDRDQQEDHAAHRLPGRPPATRGIARRTPPPSPATRSLVLLLALSTHTVFEGLALGLQATTTDVWTLCSAIVLHKVVMSFAAGLRFAESFSAAAVVWRAVACVLAFAFMTPVGIATGMVVTETGYRGVSTKMAAVVLQGLATGTFIYVTFFEILVEQMAKRPNLLKVLSVLLGYSSIAALKIFVSESQ